MAFVVFHTGFVQAYTPPVLREVAAAEVIPSSAVSDEEDRASKQTSPVAQAYVRAERGESGKSHRDRAQTVAQIMSTAVVTTDPGTLVSAAREIFQHRGFRHLPVLDAAGSIVGMISDRDLLGVELLRPGASVAQVMTPKVLTALEHTPLRNAASAMIAERISALPVVDAEHKLVGIITTSDLLRCIVNGAPVDLWV